MSNRLGALVPRTWESWREFMLTGDAMVVGVLYTFGPKRLQSAGTFAEANRHLSAVGGMKFVGLVCFILAIVLVLNRFLSGVPYFSRVAFAAGAAIYFLYGLLIGAAVVTGKSDAGAGFFHLFVISWLFFRASAESAQLPLKCDL